MVVLQIRVRESGFFGVGTNDQGIPGLAWIMDAVCEIAVGIVLPIVGLIDIAGTDNEKSPLLIWIIIS